MNSEQATIEDVREIEQRSRRIMDEIGQLLDRLHRRLAGEQVAPRPWESPARPN
jgi:hypothetical protein